VAEVVEVSPQTSRQLLRKLEGSARRRQAAEREREREIRKTAELLREGHDQDLPVLHLARAAGLTRQTVYEHLKKAGGR
jgi:AcrR family transcriptional regulator